MPAEEDVEEGAEDVWLAVWLVAAEPLEEVGGTVASVVGVLAVVVLEDNALAVRR